MGDPDELRQRLRDSAEEIRADLRIPSPRGWSADDRRIDLTRHYKDSGNMLMVERLMGHMSDDRIARRVEEQLAALRRTDPALDRGLVLAITFRESSGYAMSVSRATIDTFRLGGADYLGSDLPRYRARGYIPQGYGNWPVSTVTAASVPRNELVVAYGAVVRARRENFIARADALGLDTSVLTPDALRAWTQISFGGPNGLDYERWLRAGRPAEDFGVQTALTWMKTLIDAGEAENLNDVLDVEPLREFHRVRRAIVTVGDCRLIDEFVLLPEEAPVQMDGATDVRTHDAMTDANLCDPSGQAVHVEPEGSAAADELGFTDTDECVLTVDAHEVGEMSSAAPEASATSGDDQAGELDANLSDPSGRAVHVEPDGSAAADEPAITDADECVPNVDSHEVSEMSSAVPEAGATSGDEQASELDANLSDPSGHAVHVEPDGSAADDEPAITDADECILTVDAHEVGEVNSDADEPEGTTPGSASQDESGDRDHSGCG